MTEDSEQSQTHAPLLAKSSIAVELLSFKDGYSDTETRERRDATLAEIRTHKAEPRYLMGWHGSLLRGC